jgi:hypothetical protein
MLSSGLKDRVLHQIAQQPAPTRREVHRSTAILFGCGISGALVIFFLEGGVRVTGRPALLMALTSLGTALIAGVAMWILFTRGRSMLGRPRALLVWAPVLSAIGFLGWKYGISSLYGLTEKWPDRVGLRCLWLSVTLGALPLLAALLSWRRAASLTPVSTGAAFGAGAGLGSAVLVDLWCPVAYVPHLMLGHVLPIALLAALGGVLGTSLLRLRRP